MGRKRLWPSFETPRNRAAPQDDADAGCGRASRDVAAIAFCGDVLAQRADGFAGRYLCGVRQKLGGQLRSGVKQFYSDDATIDVVIEYDVRLDLGALQNIAA
jgi:hypothetical protein